MSQKRWSGLVSTAMALSLVGLSPVSASAAPHNEEQLVDEVPPGPYDGQQGKKDEKPAITAPTGIGVAVGITGHFAALGGIGYSAQGIKESC